MTSVHGIAGEGCLCQRVAVNSIRTRALARPLQQALSVSFCIVSTICVAWLATVVVGGIFGYPLVSSVAKSLFELTKDTLDRSDECLVLVQNHIETLQIVLRDEGYPGSNYLLHFNSSYRILVGRYLMAQSGQQHEVYFTPVKKP